VYLGDPVEKKIMEVDESERAAHQHPLGVYVLIHDPRHASLQNTLLILSVSQALHGPRRRWESYP
jgi:hypothetical protein